MHTLPTLEELIGTPGTRVCKCVYVYDIQSLTSLSSVPGVYNFQGKNVDNQGHLESHRSRFPYRWIPIDPLQSGVVVFPLAIDADPCLRDFRKNVTKGPTKSRIVQDLLEASRPEVVFETRVDFKARD